MILSFPWVVKVCLEHWMQVSIVALTGHRERLWLAEPPKGRKKPKKPLASKFCPVSECWTHESFPGADPENVCSCFSFEILGRNKTCYHELHVWDPSVLCSSLAVLLSLALVKTPRNTHVVCEHSSMHPWKGTIPCSWDVYLNHTKTISLYGVILWVSLATLRSHSLFFSLTGRQSV